MKKIIFKIKQNIIEDIVTNIKFFTIINEEKYYLKKQDNIIDYYQKLFLNKMIKVKNEDNNYSVTEIAYYLLKDKKIDKNSLLLFLNETENEYIFYFIPLNDIFNQNLKNKLIIEKNEYEKYDIRFQYSILYYQYKIKTDKVYIISNNINNKYIETLENKEFIKDNNIFKIYYKIKLYNNNKKVEIIKKIIPWIFIIGITASLAFINIYEINKEKNIKLKQLKQEISILEKEKRDLLFEKIKIKNYIKEKMRIKK